MNEKAFSDYTCSSGIGTVRFFHPQGNSLPGALLRELAALVEQAGKDTACKVIVLRSEGEKAFCAGASFDELTAIRTLEEGTAFFSGFAAVINAMRKAPKFVVARVHSKAVGGGVGLASAADYALAHVSSSVKLSELAVGIGPFVVGPAVERKTGKSAFQTLSIHATQWQSAAWAAQNGIYASVHDTVDELDASLDLLCNQLIKSNPEAMRELKSIFWEGTDHWDTLLGERAGISGRLVLSDFTRNAIESFKQKN